MNAHSSIWLTALVVGLHISAVRAGQTGFTSAVATGTTDGFIKGVGKTSGFTSSDWGELFATGQTGGSILGLASSSAQLTAQLSLTGDPYITIEGNAFGMIADQDCGDCGQSNPNGLPGCSDQGCQDTVCQISPFCCEFAWDETCASDALDQCECELIGSMGSTIQLDLDFEILTPTRFTEFIEGDFFVNLNGPIVGDTLMPGAYSITTSIGAGANTPGTLDDESSGSWVLLLTACPYDCQTDAGGNAAPDGGVGINDFLTLLAQWGTIGASCDLDPVDA